MFHLGNSGTEYWLLRIVQCWSPCELDEEKWDLPMVLYYSGMMYKYYSCVGFSYIKQNEEVNDIHKKKFNNIANIIKNILHVNCLHDISVMYNYNVLICKLGLTAPIPDSIIPVDCFQKNFYVTIFTSNDMISKFEAFTYHKLDAYYLTESMIIG